jgi:hypothetical protein
VVSIVFSLILAVGLLSTETQAILQTRTMTLQEAQASGNVTLTFSGTGSSSGDSVKVRVAKTSKAGSGTLNITVPPGSKLAAAGAGYQSMVVVGVRGIDMGGDRFSPASVITLASSAAVTYILSAYCLEFEKDNPPDSASFTVQAPDPMLACLANEGKTLSVEGLQAAIWMYTDKVTFSHMNEKFDVTNSDWTAAQNVLARCRTRLRVN